MKRAGITAALLGVLVGLSACADTQEEADDVKEVTVPYQGRDLHCVSTIYDRSLALSCDFERFYEENDTQLVVK